MNISNKTSGIPTDIEIAQNAKLKSIEKLALEYGISENYLDLFGHYMAKVKLDYLQPEEKISKRAIYVDVTAITPTPLGEGKTTTTVGLTQAFGHIGKKAVCAIRQPSMGPTFGIKGGAAGGGYSQIIPMTDFNLHLTGDIHAVSASHNLCSAAVDARIYHESRWSDSYFEKIGINRLNFDPFEIWWNRVVDMNDRSLRHILTGLGGVENGSIHETGFDITVASEVMAILALSKNLADLRSRIGKMVIGLNRSGKPVTTEDMGVAGAMTILLKDAIKPNIMQTLEGQLAFVHTGPFANIAHGNSSVIADLIASRVSDFLVTESGFGSDMGFEKFIDIKCRASGLKPDVAVLVVTVRALKMHGGGPKVIPGKNLADVYTHENCELLKSGLSNLSAHLRILRKIGIPSVVAINAFPADTEAEWDIIIEASKVNGASDAVVTKNWSEGGKGAIKLAEAVERASKDTRSTCTPFYPLESSIKDKIEILACELYGAGSVSYSPDAQKKIEKFIDLGYGKLPVCIAKTQYSLSHDPALVGAPKGYVFPITDIRLSAGAGFICPVSGHISTMPGLSSKPAYMGMDIDPVTGKITGLS